MMDYYYGLTATDAWEHWYKELSEQALKGYTQPSRVGAVVGEVINSVTVIGDPTKGIVESELRKMPVRYALGELLWYLSGSNKLEDIEKYSKYWKNLSDDGVSLNSAYGHRIFQKFGFNQWEHCKSLLQKDAYSRQAIIHIKEPSNEATKDLPCTLSLQFQIRNRKLYLTVYMRSNDIWLGFPFDVFCFTALQVKMAMELGCELGDYTHIAGSLHLYEKNYKFDESELKKSKCYKPVREV